MSKKFKDSNLKNILKNGFRYDKEREIYLFTDIISLNNDIMDKLFNLGFKIDDYHYKWLAYAFDAIFESIDSNINLEDIDIDAIRDNIFESLEADVYTSDLTAWLNSSNERVYYITEVMEEWGSEIDDGFKLLSLAQLKEKEEVYDMGFSLVQFLIEKELEEEEEDNQDEES